jgi:polyisoprenoid-binding protein YceI
MKKQIIIVCILVLAICSAFKLVRLWKVDAEHSTVKFELPGHNKKGTFRNINASIEFDENDPSASKISASIDVKTIQIGNEKEEAHLRSPDFFDAEKFPTISFVSSEIVKTDIGYSAKGKLTMKDSIKPIELPFTFSENGKSRATFNGTISLNAADYGVMKANRPSADKVIVYLAVPVSE